MELRSVLERIDAHTAQAFVTAARHVIDALLIEAERLRTAQTPAERDYNADTLSRETPARGWVSEEELRATAQRMTEALAAEKWLDGLFFAVKTLALLGGCL